MTEAREARLVADGVALLGDCSQILLRWLADGGPLFDAVVTDPPYEVGVGLNDDLGLVLDSAFWALVRVASRPGAHLFAMTGGRTWDLVQGAVRRGGWEVQDPFAWVSGGRTPKSPGSPRTCWDPIVHARAPGPATPLRVEVGRTESGRWPPSLAHDGSEEVRAVFPDAPGQLARDSASARSGGVYGSLTRDPGRLSAPRVEADRSAARFFYCARPSRQERGGVGHPTVKPLALMRWLVRLACPPGGLLLDPFMGSGTTLLAAREEGCSALGVELDEGAHRDAVERLRRPGSEVLVDGERGEGS